MKNILSYIRNKQGQAMVEMALTVPILVLLLAGMLDMGRVMHDALTITYAAREGARAAAVGHDNTTIYTAIYNASPSIDPSTISVDIQPVADRKPDDSVTVTINHNVTIVTPIISEIVSNPFPLTATAVMRVE